MDYKLYAVIYMRNRKWEGTLSGVLYVAATNEDEAKKVSYDVFEATVDHKPDDYTYFGEPNELTAHYAVVGADGRMYVMGDLI